MKKILLYVMYGAASTLGGIIVKKVCEATEDPYKKAQIKNKFSRIKSIITEG